MPLIVRFEDEDGIDQGELRESSTEFNQKCN